jgi:hypothetical protein
MSDQKMKVLGESCLEPMKNVNKYGLRISLGLISMFIVLVLVVKFKRGDLSIPWFHQTKLVETVHVPITQNKWSNPLNASGYSVDFKPNDSNVVWLVRVDGKKMYKRPPLSSPEYQDLHYGENIRYFEFALESGQPTKRAEIICVRRLR